MQVRHFSWLFNHVATVHSIITFKARNLFVLLEVFELNALKSSFNSFDKIHLISFYKSKKNIIPQNLVLQKKRVPENLVLSQSLVPHNPIPRYIVT